MNDDAFKAELDALAALSDLQVVLSRVDCFLLLSQLQLALRHPQNVGAGAVLARKLADTLENAVGRTPAIREVIRRGWAGGEAGNVYSS